MTAHSAMYEPASASRDVARPTTGPQFISHSIAFPSVERASRRRVQRKPGWVTVVDLLSVVAVVFAVRFVLAGDDVFSPLLTALVAAILTTAFYVAGVFDLEVARNTSRFLSSLGLGTVAAGGIIAGLSLLSHFAAPSFGHVAVVTICAAVTAASWRTAKVRLLPGTVARTAFLVGAHHGETLIERLTRSPHLRAVGVFTTRRSVPSVPGISALRALAARGGCDSVIVCRSVTWSDELAELLIVLRCHGVTVLDVADATEQLSESLDLSTLTPEWIGLSSRLVGASGNVFYNRVKRVVDVAGAAIGGAFALPIVAVAAALVKLESPGPVFYRQVRVGLYGSLFHVIKLRSMRADAEARGAQWAQRKDPRVTRVGRILRTTRIDELPQFWNVLKGEMSLIGPRPERPEFVSQLEQVIPYYSLRHMVKPGVTGWAQVMYPYGASVEDSRRKLEYDLYYIRHQSIQLDARVVAKTVRVMISGSNAY